MRSFDEILKEFEEFFRMDTKRTSTANSQSGKLKGRDVHSEIEIDFMDVVRGIQKHIEI